MGKLDQSFHFLKRKLKPCAHPVGESARGRAGLPLDSRAARLSFRVNTTVVPAGGDSGALRRHHKVATNSCPGVDRRVEDGAPTQGRQIALVPWGAKIGLMWSASARLGPAQGQDSAFHDLSSPLLSPWTSLLQRRAAHMDCCKDCHALSVWRRVRLGDFLDLPLVVRQSLREHQVGIRLRGGVGVGRVQQFLRIPKGVASL